MSIPESDITGQNDQPENARETVERLGREGRSAGTPATPSRASRLLVVIPVALVLLVLVAAAIAFQAGRDTTGATVPDSSVPSHITEDFGVLREVGAAPVEVVVYEDFMCPACQQFEEMQGSNIDLLIDEGVISVEYRMLSFLDRASTTDYSTRAMNAYLTVVGDGVGDIGEQFRKTLFLNQPAEGGPGLSDEDLVDIAVNLGSDRGEMERSQDGLLMKQYILNANDAASKDGVNQTPTVMVDGEALKNPFTDFVPAVLEAAEAAGIDTDALVGGDPTGGDGNPSNDTGTDVNPTSTPTPGTQQPEKDSK